jgi:peptide/nickel transport system substrate-binding protein
VTYIYDTLLLADATGAVQPWLASRYERSPDGLSYTFELRDNVRWHDGRPLTPEDVVFSFEYFAAKRSKLPPYLIGGPQNVEGVKAVGGRRVEIRLDRPVVTFLRGAASTFPIVPKHVWAPIDDPARAQEVGVLVGTGPYRLDTYTRGEGAYLYTANDGFFLGKPFVQRLELRAVEDELNALRAGAIDAAGPPSSGAPVGRDALAPFRSDPAYGIVEGPAEFPSTLNWNLAKGGALADVRFRRACAMAIDREGLVKRVLGGMGKPGNPGFLPPDHPFHVDVEQYRFDRAGANRLLDDSGYPREGSKGMRRGPDGKPLRFTMAVIPVLSPVVELVVDALEAVGVQLDLDPVEPFQLFTNQVDYEMAVVFYGGVSGDPDYLRTVYSSKGTRGFQSARGYADPEFDNLAEKQLVTLDEGERKGLIARMQQIVARDVPVLHLYYTVPFVAFRKSVFTQWSYDRGAGPYNKQLFVTGTNRGGLTVRPIKEGA